MSNREASTSAVPASEDYTVDGEKITINRSDGDEARWPQVYYRDDGNGMIELLKPSEAKTTREWKQKIGTLLAQELGVVDKSSRRQFILTEFPTGYRLFTHLKGPKANPRKDDYLHGTDVARNFRSPNEFILHAHWMCIGMPVYPTSGKPICQCKYCAKHSEAVVQEAERPNGEGRRGRTRVRKSVGAGAGAGKREKEKERRGKKENVGVDENDGDAMDVDVDEENEDKDADVPSTPSRARTRSQTSSPSKSTRTPRTPKSPTKSTKSSSPTKSPTKPTSSKSYPSKEKAKARIHANTKKAPRRYDQAAVSRKLTGRRPAREARERNEKAKKDEGGGRGSLMKLVLRRSKRR